MTQTVIRVPINNVKGGGDYTGEIRVGSQGAIANVILDTGSSTLAVVPRVYKIADDQNVTSTSFAQLVTYGTGGWTGPVLETTLSMGSGGNQASVKTYIAIADEQLPHNLGPADRHPRSRFQRSQLRVRPHGVPHQPRRQPACHIPLALPR